MPTAKDLLCQGARRQRVIDAICRLIGEEMGRKRGLKVLPLKAGYKLVKGIRPGFIRGAVDFLLDEFCDALDPTYQIWSQAPLEGRAPLGPTLVSNRSKVADGLLGVTDRRAEKSSHRTLRKAYLKLRPIAKGHVEEAIPGIGRTLGPLLREAEAEAAAKE